LGSVKLFPNLEAALKGVFNRVMTELELGVNEIGDEGAKAIAEALKVNAVLTTLSLWNNSIGDEGATAIAQAEGQRGVDLGGPPGQLHRR
jgi:Ran GTPase-activating protein 1